MKASKIQVDAQLDAKIIDKPILSEQTQDLGQVISLMPQNCQIFESLSIIYTKLMKIDEKLSRSQEKYERAMNRGYTVKVFEVAAYLSSFWKLPEGQFLKDLDRVIQVARFKAHQLMGRSSDEWDSEYRIEERNFFKNVFLDLERFLNHLQYIQNTVGEPDEIMNY